MKSFQFFQTSRLPCPDPKEKPAGIRNVDFPNQGSLFLERNLRFVSDHYFHICRHSKLRDNTFYFLKILRLVYAQEENVGDALIKSWGCISLRILEKIFWLNGCYKSQRSVSLRYNRIS